MHINDLKDTALKLPLSPGVYIMRDKQNRVIYVGKAKKLKNRVTQYFQDTASHSLKTKLMVSHVDHFDVIIAASEFEALVLECSLIKRHQPKYNILLKDDKGFPFVRLSSSDAYPMLSLVNQTQDDGAEYYGPFGSRGVTNSMLKAVRSALGLPDCTKHFPRDIGKDRPCLNYHMKLCAGWCQQEKTQEEYISQIQLARKLLNGDFKSVTDELKKQMLLASDALNFELAASIRDRINAIEALNKDQKVIASVGVDTDVIGYAQTETKACVVILHYSNGDLLDKDYQVISTPEDSSIALSALIKQYYYNRRTAPKYIFLPFELEDIDLFAQLLEQQFQKKATFKVPKRGDKLRLIELANQNAKEEALRVTKLDESHNATLLTLRKMLGIASLNRIESFDISNISGTDNVAAMVVFENGKPRRSEYKRFRIDHLPGPDDYASMFEAVTRRFQRYLDNDPKFSRLPDLLLIDGGVNHASVALDALRRLEIDLPVFGMVKDDRHRTRALVTPQGDEIRIDNQSFIFSFIGSIQEETHRFAIGYHKKLRSKRLRYSQLDNISGVGPKRKELLLKTFGSIRNIGAAQLQELERYVPADVALAIYKHFREGRTEQ